MASGNMVVIPSNGANIQTASGLPSATGQASGATPYPQHGAQQLGTSTSAPQQVPQKGPLERFLKAEPKVLGAVQIMTGLMHVAFGIVIVSLPTSHNGSLTINGGYPFWGGIFFISSGSLCILAANCQNAALVKSSVRMNIICAIMALTGIVVCIADMAVRSTPSGEHNSAYSIKNAAYNGLSVVLVLFSLLEFCITVSLAHFGCQSTSCAGGQPTLVFVPYQVNRDGTVTCEPNQHFPPTYNNVVTEP